MIKEKYVENIKETTISIVNSKVESIRLKNNTKTSLRVYKDGYIGVAGAIGSYNEAELEKEAIEALSQKIECSWEPSANRTEQLSKKTDVFDEEKLAEEIEELLLEMTAAQPDFIFSHKVILQEINTKITNDHNLKLEYEDKTIMAGFIFKEKSSTNIMDGFIEYTDRQYDRKKILDQVNMTLNAYKNQVEMPQNGKYPVLFVENEVPVNKFITDLNAHLFASGSSIFSDKKGQKAFNENFTFYGSANPEDGHNTPFFDAEGTVNKNYRYALVENGIINGPYTDKRSAKKYNLELTGAAKAAYDGVPEMQFTNYKIKESEKTAKELLNGQMGIVVLVASGGDFTPAGDYATPVQLGMLFDGEKFIGRLPEFQISSNVYDMFGKDFRGVGKDKLYTYTNRKYCILDMMVTNA
jgi:PmbA protein